ncbi:MAG: XdhC family protein [Gemmatimonadaceae bacterium]|nr:XdhC family protein [Gemmatimonadaceae bacterium]
MRASLTQLLAECARLASGVGIGALASVVRRRGSLPMSATAKLLVTAGGARLGTVGGGCLEAEIIAAALEVVETRTPRITIHTLNAELAGDYGLTCGGTAHVLIEPIFPDAVLARVYTDAAALLAAGGRGTIETGLDWSAGVVKQLHTPPVADIDIPQLDPTRALDPIAPPPRLVIFGGGHVGARVAEAAAFAGFRVTLCDDRAEFADAARHPQCERTLVCDFADVSATALAAEDFVVIATRGHAHDTLIAAQIATRPLRYLGMLGSRRKGALAGEVLASWGVPAEAIARIRTPVGLAIGADTPEEIAISVVADLIATRRRVAAPSLSER